MSNILHRLSIDAPPERVQDLAATREGIEQWCWRQDSLHISSQQSLTAVLGEGWTGTGGPHPVPRRERPCERRPVQQRSALGPAEVRKVLLAEELAERERSALATRRTQAAFLCYLRREAVVHPDADADSTTHAGVDR
jgi:hypothetical protein